MAKFLPIESFILVENAMQAWMTEQQHREEKHVMETIRTRALAIAMALTTTVGFLNLCTARAVAQAGQDHVIGSQNQQLTNAQSEILRIVRNSTERFKKASVAEAEGYKPIFGCVTGPDAGAMGLHFLKQEFLDHPPLTANGEIDPTRPQIVIYEPLPGGDLRLIGADYLLFADAWDKDHPGNTPQLMGQLFHYFESPNRFGLPAFYTLHVWAWKENPNGAFVNWHPDVSCQSFSGQTF
jgi:hypothetical protein